MKTKNPNGNDKLQTCRHPVGSCYSNSLARAPHIKVENFLNNFFPNLRKFSEFF